MIPQQVVEDIAGNSLNQKFTAMILELVMHGHIKLCNHALTSSLKIEVTMNISPIMRIMKNAMYVIVPVLIVDLDTTCTEW